MNSMLWKSGVIAVFAILSRCGTDTVSTIHPLLTLNAQQQNNTSQVVITTTVANQYPMHRIVNDTCMLKLTYNVTIEGNYTSVTDSVAIANDPAAFQSGKFSGIWVVPDSLLSIDTIWVSGCVSDETAYNAYASCMLYATPK
jgi:hypothetical protein